MSTSNPKVDLYLVEGCGRCEHYQTPKCKVHFWPEELRLLREIVLETELIEEYKWSQPCYTFRGKNILVVTAFKNYAAVAFFKGALLKDSAGVLTSPGNDSQTFRQLRYTNTDDIINQKDIIKDYIVESIENEKLGLKVEFKKQPNEMPSELEEELRNNPELKNAFESLTPGRQRSYFIHIAQAKQSKTRIARIKRCIPKIYSGKGFNEY